MRIKDLHVAVAPLMVLPVTASLCIRMKKIQGLRIDHKLHIYSGKLIDITEIQIPHGGILEQEKQYDKKNWKFHAYHCHRAGDDLLKLKRVF